MPVWGVWVEVGGGGGEGVQNNSGDSGGSTNWEPVSPPLSKLPSLSPSPPPSPSPSLPPPATHRHPLATHAWQAELTTPVGTGVALIGPEAPGCAHPRQIQALLRCSALGSPLQACRRWDLRPHPPAHRKGPDFFPRVSPQIEQGPKPAGPGLDSTSPDRISLNRETWPGRCPSVSKNPPGDHRGVPPPTPGPLRPRARAGRATSRVVPPLVRVSACSQRIG